MFSAIKKFFTGGQQRRANGKKTILVIDDGEVERKFISRTLQKAGFSVLTADDGAPGLALAKDKKPDLVLLDFVMPGMNGDVVCKYLKDDVTTRDIPVIFLTGSVKPASVIESFEAGAEYYLAKPISAAALIHEVEKILAETGTAPSA